MTCYDSSVLIDYLDGDETAVAYVESHLDERAVTPPLAMFEVYQGEVFKTGPADFAALDQALDWVTVVDETAALVRAAAELQAELHNRGMPLAARDAYIAGAAHGLGERLVVADDDFDGPGLTDVLAVEVL